MKLPTAQEMERAYKTSDASYDGVFFLAVRTTGIFCKPSCPARKPDSRNVVYYLTTREAIVAGFRPCKRCHPLESNGSTPLWVKDLLERVDSDPTARFSDGVLRTSGIDPARARRYFQKKYGMTFQAYCRMRRLGKALEQIRLGTDLDDVALGYGYNSHSGFRDAFSRTFGNSPGRSRSADCILTAWIESPLGPFVAGATSEGICLLEFTDRRMLETQFASLRKRFTCAIVPGENRHIKQLKIELQEYFQKCTPPVYRSHRCTRNSVSAKGVEGIAQDSVRKNCFGRRDRKTHRITFRTTGCGTRKWIEPHFYCDSVSQSCKQERRSWRLRRRTLAEAKITLAGKREKHCINPEQREQRLIKGE